MVSAIVGTLGADTLLGTLGADSIIGFDGNDVIVGFESNDTLLGGNGADSLFGDEGNDSLNGEVGNDFIAGYTGADRLNGGNGADTLLGWQGNDFLNGGAGNDVLDGEGGNDTLIGGDGADSLAGQYGNDVLDGEVGNDFIGGGNGADTLIGGDGADILLGWEGNDSLNGEAGDDILDGEVGNDTLIGGDGNDTLIGGDDSKNPDDGADYLDGGAGNDFLLGLYGNDTLIGGDGNDTLIGSNGDDTLNGGFDSDFLSGGYGNDVSDGGDGADTLFGDAGNDSLSGGAGNDYIFSFAGLDTLAGGLGADTLAVNIQSVATITDFSRLEGDKIELLGNKSQYRLESYLNPNNLSQLETVIYYQNQKIAIVAGAKITWDDIIITNDSSGQFSVPQSWLTRWGGFEKEQKSLAGDFNGDGNDDILVGFNDRGAISVDAHLSTGSRFTAKVWLNRSGGFWERQKWLSGDFNGDGKDEVAIGFSDRGAISVDAYLSTGSGFNYQRFLSGFGGFWDEQKWLSGDFNGDGNDDILVGFSDRGAISVDAYLSTGSGFNYQRFLSGFGGFWNEQKWLSGDFNGDGNDDLAVIFNDRGGITIDAYLSTGSGFNYQRWLTQYGEFWGEQKWQVGDFNGDGLDDLAAEIDYILISGVEVQLSTGSGFTSELWGYDNAVVAQDSKLLSGDFNGDGLDDLALDFNHNINVQLVLPISKDELTDSSTVDPSLDRIVVNTLVDENDGINVGGVSLRDALSAINWGGIITFAPAISGGTIKLTNGELLIDRSLSIKGSNITVDAQNASRVFNISDGRDNSLSDVFIESLTITGGNDTFSRGYGGGISNKENLTVSNTTITNNSGTGGAGIHNSSVPNGAESVLNVINTTISNNSANAGGGITNSSATLNVINSTISNNVAKASTGGGGIWNIYGTTSITSSTISGNIGEGYSGAGGVDNAAGTVKVTNSIIAANINNQSPNERNISGGNDFISGGNNLIGNNRGKISNFVNGVNGDIVGTATNPIDPLLSPLQDNGGPVFTQALLPGSPAIDAGNNNLLAADILDLNNNGTSGESIPFDSRGLGFDRIVNGTSDIGAFEVQIASL